MAQDRSHDWPLDYCCMREKAPRRRRPNTTGMLDPNTVYEEVCLRCGLHYSGTFDHVSDTRRLHVCDPGKRLPIPRWALVGRKYDRSLA